MEKLLVAIPASILAAGVVSNLPDTLVLDPEIKDPNVQAENSFAWEVYRIFYHAIAKSLSSPDWPTPSVDPAPLLGKVAPLISGGLQSLLSGNGPLAALLPGLLNKLLPAANPASPPATAKPLA